MDNHSTESAQLGTEAVVASVRSPRAPSSEPSVAAYPNDISEDERDYESADSHSHKRPRLDSGAASHRAIRSRSADLVLSPSSKGPSVIMDLDLRERTSPTTADAAKTPTQIPSKITIHIRNGNPASSPLPSGPLSSTIRASSPVQECPEEHVDDNESSTVDSEASSETARDDSAIVTDQNTPNGTPTSPERPALSVEPEKAASPVEGSSPSVPIEIDDPEDIDEDGAAFNSIEVEGEEDIVERFIHTFPYYAVDGTPTFVAKQIARHVEAEADVDKELFRNFVSWFSEHERLFGNQPMYWRSLYYGNSTLMAQIAAIMSRVSDRSLSLATTYTDEDIKQDLPAFFKGYTNFVIRLLQAAVELAKQPSSYLDKPSAAALVHPHLHQIRVLLWPDNPLIKRCTLDGFDFGHTRLKTIILSHFLRNREFAMKYLHQFFTLCLDTLKETPEAALGLVQSLSLAVQTISFIFSDPILNSKVYSPRSAYARMMLDMFFALNTKLQEAVDKQNDPLSCDIRREIHPHIILLLEKIIQYDEGCMKKLFDEFVQSCDVDGDYSHDSVIIPVWKILLMKNYLCNGRMELRVIGVDTMAQDLVDFFNNNRQHDGMVRSEAILPSFQVVANALVKEKIVEYILGVSSHPQIVSRCGNIVGFLVVTNNFRQDEINLVWQTLLSSEDPRMTAAIFITLAFVTKSLTVPLEHHILCQKMVDQPLPVFGHEAAEFTRTLLHRQREALCSTDYDPDYMLAFVKMCVFLICRWTATNPPTAPMKQIYLDSVDSMTYAARHMPPELRQVFYADTIVRIGEGENVPALMQAMFLVLQSFPGDVDDLAPDLIPLCMQSFSAFAESRKKEQTVKLNRSRLLEQFEFRLNLIFYLLALTNFETPAEITSVFWDHLFGDAALDNDSREMSWKLLTSFAFERNGNKRRHSIGKFYEPYLGSIQPEHFVPSFVQFADKIARAKIRDLPDGKDGADNVLSLPGIDLVWRVMLSAPDKAGEESTVKFFITLYLTRNEIERISGESLEANHASLVTRCIKRMDEAHTILKSLKAGNGSADDMDTADPDLAQNEERVFRRIVHFLNAMLLHVRRRADLVVSPSTSVEEPRCSESPVISGERVTIKYQVHTTKEQNPQREVVVGDLDTRKELHQKLSRLTGLAKFKIIWQGAYFNLMDNPMQSLRDCNAAGKGLMLIKEDASDPMANHLSSASHAKTLFEKDILREFEILYKFMDGEDAISHQTFELLKHFEPHESICILVADQSSDPEEVFPPKQIYKIHYAFRCLESLLKDQTQLKAQTNESTNQEFTVHSIRLLENLCVQRPIPDDENDRSNYLFLFSTAVPIWNAFLREVGRQDESPFSSGTAVIARILEVLEYFLLSPTSAGVAGETYELMLSASFACSEAWSAFSSSERLSKLHKEVLLSNPNPHIRGNIVHTIKTRIARFPKDCHMGSWELIKFYWETVASLIPAAAKSPMNCMELFLLSIDLFARRFSDRKLDLDDDEIKDLENYQTEWANILFSYERREFIGREVIDHVIAGLCTLIQNCYQVLKDVRDLPPLKGLAQSLWESILFAELTDDQDYNTEPETPLLDSKTRNHVYSLLKAITIDHNLRASARIANCVDNVSSDTDDPGRWQIDRSRLIRPECGYLGLRNLGNTCYMNSLLTQLYMNPDFRSFMISQPLGDARKQALLRETQILFSNMQNSFGPWGDAMAFTRQICTYTGEGINIAEQMDVEEFFNLLFEQWEENIQSSRAKETFRSIYGGKLVYQVKSKECEHVSEREEPCFNIQCDVQGKANLYESLQAFCEGDVMQGDNKYKCEKCGGKLVDAVRRSCLKDIPNHLILHLKRFEYDIGLQRRSKINDLFEFPMEIDMTPYTFDYLANPEKEHGEDKFELVGVLVHKGHAEHGHYISYIRARPGQEGRAPSWLLFDDSDVTEFDQRELGEACYGGTFETKDAYSTMHPSVKAYSAYMLFYQRSSSIKKVGPINGEPKDFGKVPIPEILEQQINIDNGYTLRSYCLFGEPHQRFVRDLCYMLQNASHDDERHSEHRTIISACLRHIWRVSSRVKDSPEFLEIIGILRSVMGMCSRCTFLVFRWFAENISELRDLMVRCISPRVRHQIHNVVLFGFKQLRNDPELYGIDVTTDVPDFDPSSSGVLISMAEVFRQIARDQVAWTARGFEEFFMLLASLVDRQKHEAWVLVASEFVEICLQILLVHQVDTITKMYPKTATLIEKKVIPFNSLSEFLVHLLYHVDLSRTCASQDRITEFDPETEKMPVTHVENSLLTLTAKDGLIWLMRVFEKWDTARADLMFVPSETLKLCLLGNRSSDSLAILARTLKEGIDSGSEVYIRSALMFLQHCPDRTLLRTVMKAMDKAVQDYELTNGHYFVEYYSALRYIENEYLPPNEEGLGVFYDDLVAKCHLFAPALLTYEDEDVRVSARDLIIDVLLRFPPLKDQTAEEPTEAEVRRATEVRLVFYHCWEKAKYHLEVDSSKNFLGPIILILQNCAQFTHSLQNMDGDAAEMLKDEKDELIHENIQVALSAFEAAPVGTEDELAQSALSEYTDGSDDDVVLDSV